MKKVKFYIFASILGLTNISSCNTNSMDINIKKSCNIATSFVENENFPYFYNQANNLVEGIHWFKSKTDKNKVFYIVTRKIDKSNKDGYKFLCDEQNEFFEKLKKYHFVALYIEESDEMIIPFEADNEEQNFYKYLYNSYKKAESGKGDPIPNDLLFDNPLDNLGWFYNGLGKGKDLLDRVAKNSSLRSYDKGLTKLNMFAINTGNKNQKSFDVPEKFSLEIFENKQNKNALHLWIQNVYKFFENNIYLQHGDEKTKFIVDSYSNDEKLGKKYQGSTVNCDLPLQNQKHVFFSPVIPGYEKLNSYSTWPTYYKFCILENNRFFSLPIVNVSEDMKTNADRRCYIGSPEDVLKMLIYDISVDRSEKNFSDQIIKFEKLNQNFTLNEIRIPVYMFAFADSWFDKRKYFKDVSEKMKVFEKLYTEIRKQNNRSGKFFRFDNVDSNKGIEYPKY